MSDYVPKFNFLDIVMEAKKPKEIKKSIKVDDPPEDSDYTEGSDDDSTTGSNTNEEPEDDESTNETDDYTTGSDEDFSTDETTSEPSDDSSDGNTDDSTDDDDDDGNVDQPGSENVKNNALMKDYSKLYQLLKSINTKFNSYSKNDILINKIISQVSKNITALQKELFDYMIFSFETKKYVENLYQYNFFIQAVKINIEILKKIDVLK